MSGEQYDIRQILAAVMYAIGNGDVDKERMRRVMKSSARSKDKASASVAVAESTDRPDMEVKLRPGGFISALFRNCAGAANGIRTWMGHVNDMIERRPGMRPRRITDARSLDKLSEYIWLRVTWLVPDKDLEQTAFEEKVFKFCPDQVMKDNVEELSVKYLINCPIMRHEHLLLANTGRVMVSWGSFWALDIFFKIKSET